MLLRRLAYAVSAFLVLVVLVEAAVGSFLGQAFLHPANLNPDRASQTDQMLLRTGAAKESFAVRAPDGFDLRGWKVRPPSPSGNWVLLFHGISDNRTGVLGPAEFLLRHGYSLVMMDSRAHGQSGGDMATYGWKERYDTVAIASALYSSENVRHLAALDVSMGAAIALQSAAAEPRIEAVAVEDPFADLREESYDYAGLQFSPLLGKTLFRPASIAAMHEMGKLGGFDPGAVSPEKAVAARPFPVLLICGTEGPQNPLPPRRAHLPKRGRPEAAMGRSGGRARRSPGSRTPGIRGSRACLLRHGLRQPPLNRLGSRFNPRCLLQCNCIAPSAIRAK